MAIKELIIFAASICAGYAVANGLCAAFPTPSNIFVLIGQFVVVVIHTVAASVVSVVGLELLAGIVYALFRSMFRDSEEEATRGE